MNFATTEYQQILDKIHSTNHEFAKFSTPPKTDKYVILRHDVDFSLFEALRIAKLENELGVNSTFFTLLTSPYYNPLADGSVDILKEIVSLGHEIGLHYDASRFENLDEKERRTRIALLANTLGNHIEQQINCIAQHKPASTNIRPTFPDFIDAYEPRFFNDIPYISDSRMMFRIDDIFNFIEDTKAFQLLIHPIWWTDKASDRASIFNNVRNKISKQMAILLESELSSIKRFLKNIST